MDFKMDNSIQVDVESFKAIITINAPERLNSLNKMSWEVLGEKISELSSNNKLRCIILRGAGDKAFAAGADIKEFKTERANSSQAKKYGEIIAKTMNSIATSRHPTIALIKGSCVGGGLELAACCDIRICGESSCFGIPVSKLGLVMAHAELKLLIGVVGPSKALEILLEGQIFGARKALEMGLINKVVPDDKVENEVFLTADRIIKGAPLVAQWHKKFILRLMDPKPLTEAEINEGYACFDTKDYKEGIDSFIKKQKPIFNGH